MTNEALFIKRLGNRCVCTRTVNVKLYKKCVLLYYLNDNSRKSKFTFQKMRR